MDTERILKFSGEMGRQLMENGAEIYRVEESVRRILKAYGCHQTEVFAIPSFMVVNVETGERNYVRSLRSRPTSLNLRRLHRLNALCREICQHTPPVEEAEARFREILEEPLYGRWASYFAYGLVAFFFTLFWGGSLADAVAAFPSGLIVRLLVRFMSKVQANVFFTNLVTSMRLAIPPLAFEMAGLPLAVDKIIIGTIMLLVPGLAITNVMRDVLAGDFLTALTRFAEVLIVAMGISIGIAMAITGTRALAAWGI